MIRSFFTKFFTKYERGIYSLFCVLWCISLLFYFVYKDKSYNRPRFEAVAKIGATWEEVNKEYKLSREIISPVNSTTLVKDTILSGGECSFIDGLPTCRIPQKEDDMKTVHEFFPNARNILKNYTLLTSGYVLIFDDADRIIARFHYST